VRRNSTLLDAFRDVSQRVFINSFFFFFWKWVCVSFCCSACISDKTKGKGGKKSITAQIVGDSSRGALHIFLDCRHVVAFYKPSNCFS
jgi:hypothetical protein